MTRYSRQELCGGTLYPETASGRLALETGGRGKAAQSDAAADLGSCCGYNNIKNVRRVEVVLVVAVVVRK